MPTRHRYLELFIQVVILYSIVTHFLEVEHTDPEHAVEFFFWSELVVATLFTVEYLVRWIASRSLWYPLRPMAVVDLLAVLPFYVSSLIDLRSLRLVRTLRVLRLFKLERHNHALQNLLNAFHRVRHEFAIVGFAALVVVWCSSLAVFELEREVKDGGFGRLSDAVWFVLVTVTTVGYGDKVPHTAGGKFVAGCTMIAGLALFGTFISLIGTAFLEEVRRSIRQASGAAPGGPDGEAAVPESLGSMTQATFDPRQVLQAIDGGALHGAGGGAHPETVRLLAVACRALLGEGKNEGGGVVESVRVDGPA
jgi:voltage-gated potassium channel